MSNTENIGDINTWVEGASSVILDAAEKSGLNPTQMDKLSKFMGTKSKFGEVSELASAYGEGGNALLAQKTTSMLIGGIVGGYVGVRRGRMAGFAAGLAASEFVDQNWDTINNPLPAFDEHVAPSLLEDIFDIQEALAGFFADFEAGIESALDSLELALDSFLSNLESYVLEGTLGISEWLEGRVSGFLTENVNVGFKTAQSLPPAYSDPLALDLDGDGIETVGVGDWQNTVLFDHDGDGVRDGTGWLSGDDGWLVRDRNANGTIDSGAELFGDNTVLGNGTTAAEGFSALADLDSNADGVIDASDAAFGELKVWQDRNQDGISQADELTSLTDRGIASIDLNATAVDQDQNGNRLTATSSFTRSDGTTGTLGNLDLAASTFYTQFTDAHAGDGTLPDIHGSRAATGGMKTLVGW